jgi:hypothetical protein
MSLSQQEIIQRFQVLLHRLEEFVLAVRTQDRSLSLQEIIQRFQVMLHRVEEFVLAMRQ